MEAQPPRYSDLSPEQKYAQYRWTMDQRAEVGAYVRIISVEAVKHVMLINSAGVAAMIGFVATLRLQSTAAIAWLSASPELLPRRSVAVVAFLYGVAWNAASAAWLRAVL
jgi:hypothetical protein